MRTIASKDNTDNYLKIDFMEGDVWVYGINGRKICSVNVSIADMQSLAHKILELYPTGIEKNWEYVLDELIRANEDLAKINEDLAKIREYLLGSKEETNDNNQ